MAPSAELKTITVAATGQRLRIPVNCQQLTVEQLAPYGLRPDMPAPGETAASAAAVPQQTGASKSGGGFVRKDNGTVTV